MKKENTLMARTDALENTHEAGTPESREDDHGIPAANGKRKRGGKVEGAKPRHRMDRKGYAGGGAVKGSKGTKVNVIVMPQGGGAGGGAPPPMPPHPPMPPPGAIPPAPPPKPPMMAPGGPGAPMTPGGAPPPMMGRAKGGRVDMEAGSGGGLGRLEKIKEYGKNAKSGEGK